MELNDFIKMVLVNIVQGIDAAQEESLSKGLASKICPQGSRLVTDKNGLPVIDSQGRHMRDVSFDVAVSAYEENSKEVAGNINAKAKIPIIQIFSTSGAMSASKGSGNKNETVSRMKFDVPIALSAAARKEPDK